MMARPRGCQASRLSNRDNRASVHVDHGNDNLSGDTRLEGSCHVTPCIPDPRRMRTRCALAERRSARVAARRGGARALSLFSVDHARRGDVACARSALATGECGMHAGRHASGEAYLTASRASAAGRLWAGRTQVEHRTLPRVPQLAEARRCGDVSAGIGSPASCPALSLNVAVNAGGWSRAVHRPWRAARDTSLGESHELLSRPACL
jgi:hypothetical protein